MKVGIIGFGFIGKTYSDGFYKMGNDIVAFDPYKKIPKEYGNNKFEEVKECPIIFLCLPTVPTDDGKGMDFSPIKETLDKLHGTDSIVVMESSVLPGTTRKLAKEYDIKNIVFIPEFLTMRTAMSDFMCPDRILIGVDGTIDLRLLYNLYKEFKCPKIVTTFETAELTKLASNCFFATKVTFANEFFDIANLFGVDWDEVKDYLYMDNRIGNNHMKVIENSRGFGNVCLPKDTYQLWYELKEKDIDIALLRQVIDKNYYFRKGKKEWEA